MLRHLGRLRYSSSKQPQSMHFLFSTNKWLFWCLGDPASSSKVLCARSCNLTASNGISRPYSPQPAASHLMRLVSPLLMSSLVGVYIKQLISSYALPVATYDVKMAFETLRRLGPKVSTWYLIPCTSCFHSLSRSSCFWRSMALPSRDAIALYLSQSVGRFADSHRQT
jgi:hypothetical protein